MAAYPPGLWLTSPAGWLPRTGIGSGTLRSVIEYESYLYLYCKRSVLANRCLFQASFRQKKTYTPKKTAAKLCALSLFFGRGSESQIYHGNFLLIDNKHRKLFVIMQPKGCKFMRKMHQNMFSGRQTYFWCILRINLHHFKFWKSVNIWRRYGQEFSVLIFWLTVRKCL